MPNSFIYRFVPNNARDLLAGGKLQTLQVMSKLHTGPMVFNSADALTQDMVDLHTYGITFVWVTIHDTNVDRFADFDANALAKAKSGSPFKRPENGVFRPGSSFREFFFSETVDTNATSTANPQHGGFGGVMKLAQSSPGAGGGRRTLFFKGDREHTAFDNV